MTDAPAISILSANDYHFTTHWRVRGSITEVADILDDPLELPRWWPDVYLDVREAEPEEPGRRALIGLHTKGRLPYTLRWTLRVIESRYPRGFTLHAWGDLEGRGTWTFEQDGEFVNVNYDWRVRAGKPFLRYLSFLLKPLFAANHNWAMARGEESLRRELPAARVNIV
jgi:hypothetical protein